MKAFEHIPKIIFVLYGFAMLDQVGIEHPKAEDLNDKEIDEWYEKVKNLKYPEPDICPECGSRLNEENS